VLGVIIIVALSFFPGEPFDYSQLDGGVRKAREQENKHASTNNQDEKREQAATPPQQQQPPQENAPSTPPPPPPPPPQAEQESTAPFQDVKSPASNGPIRDRTVHEILADEDKITNSRGMRKLQRWLRLSEDQIRRAVRQAQVDANTTGNLSGRQANSQGGGDHYAFIRMTWNGGSTVFVCAEQYAEHGAVTGEP